MFLYFTYHNISLTDLLSAFIPNEVFFCAWWLKNIKFQFKNVIRVEIEHIVLQYLPRLAREVMRVEYLKINICEFTCSCTYGFL